jgi:cysteinyl-tRNA synthetase
MSLRLFDSLTREIRELKPSQPDGVFRFYNCGLTVYDSAHIGNFRTFLVNDVIRRLLDRQFGKGKVRHVRNLTDVDDKTIRRAREENRPLSEITGKWIAKFHADCEAFNCRRPHVEPRATDPKYLSEQINMIEVLLSKGNAYRAPDGSVYFKVASFPAYGELSRLKERQLQPGAAVKAAAADADEKEDGSDFALWKAWKPDDGPNRWPGPKGAAAGRPGWHIECSAMSKAILGDTLDLHTGGVDLLFPHHENEIAQSQCCNGATLSHHWYHSEHLLSDGKKMSKSLGNLYTLDDLVAKGFSPMAVRYALLAGHPRRQLNFMLDSLHAAESALGNLRVYRTTLAARSEGAHSEVDSGLYEDVLRHLDDDLNIPSALGALFLGMKARAVDTLPAQTAAEDLVSFDSAMEVLGFDLRIASDGPPSAIRGLAERRWAARLAKDYKAADALRAELAVAGWVMLDGKDGYKIERLKP